MNSLKVNNYVKKELVTQCEQWLELILGKYSLIAGIFFTLILKELEDKISF